MKASRRQKGLTLVETLAALAIMGLVVSALLVLIGQNTRFAAEALNRAYAQIAADNAMVEAIALIDRAETGIEVEAVSLAGREWTRRITIDETPVDAVIRINIEILSLEGQVIASAQSLAETSS